MNKSFWKKCILLTSILVLVAIFAYMLIMQLTAKDEYIYVNAKVYDKTYIEGYIAASGKFVEPGYYVDIKYKDMQKAFDNKELFEHTEKGDTVEISVRKTSYITGKVEEEICPMQWEE